MEFFIAIWFLFVVLSTWVGSSKGEPVAGFFAGLLMGPLGALLACISKGKPQRKTAGRKAAPISSAESATDQTAPQATSEPEVDGTKAKGESGAPPESTGQGGDFLSYFATAFLFILALMVVSEILLSMEFWFIVLAVYAFAIPIFFTTLYIGVINQTRDLFVLSPKGWLYRIVKGRLLRSLIWAPLSIATSFLLLIEARGYDASEWFAFFMVVPAFWLCFRMFRNQFSSEVRPFFLNASALGLANRLCPALMVLVFFVVAAGFGNPSETPPISLEAAINNSLRDVGEAGGSVLVSVASRWSAYIDGVIDYALHGLKRMDAMWAQFATVLIWYYFVFWNACRMISCFLIPPWEYRRVFAPLSTADVPPKLSAPTVGMVSAIFVLFTFFIYFQIFAYVEQGAKQIVGDPSSPWTRPELLTPQLERIDDQLYQPGTIEKLHAAKVDALRELRISIRRLDREAEQAFDQVAANIDRYLDWYYSLPAEYARIGKMMVGELETYMLEKLEEKLKAGAPFREFRVALDDALAASEAARKAYRETAREILDANRVDSPVAHFRIDHEQSMDDLLAFQLHKDFITFKTRMLASGTGGAAVSGLAGGFVAKKIVAKVAGKNAIKLATKAVAKVVASKTAGTAGGAGAGAATGAAVGSVIPGVGTAVGAAIGGIAGGILVGVSIDALLLELEEAVSREDFREELMAEVREYQYEFEQEIMRMEKRY